MAPTNDEQALHAALRRNLSQLRAWQANPFDYPRELCSAASLLRDPLDGIREFFFGDKEDSFSQLCKVAGFSFDHGRMEDYVFHQMGKARVSIRAYRLMMDDCLEMSEESKDSNFASG